MYLLAAVLLLLSVWPCSAVPLHGVPMLDNGLGSSLPYVRGLNIQQQEKPKDLSGAFLSLAARSRHRNVRSVGRYWPVVPDQGELPNPYASKDPNPKNMRLIDNIENTIGAMGQKSASASPAESDRTPKISSDLLKRVDNPELLLRVLARKNNPKLRVDLKSLEEAEHLMKNVEQTQDTVSALFYDLKLKGFPYDTSTPNIPGEFQYPKAFLTSDKTSGAGGSQEKHSSLGSDASSNSKGSDNEASGSEAASNSKDSHRSL